MASISNEPNGRRVIQFVAPDGSRKSIRLGKVSQRAAEAFQLRVEQLLAAKLTGHAIEADAARWVAALPDALADRLARVGLVARRGAGEAVMLGAFVAEYIGKRTDAKPRTIINLRATETVLVEYMGANRPLQSISAGEAVEWRIWLQTHRELGENTIRRHCGRAKQFFRHAMKRRLVADNPFAELKSRVTGNQERFYFIDRETAEKVIAACPDAQWRLLFALSRFGGLRCPSEHLALRWGDIDWERNRIRVPSPKTEHHEGKAERWIPLFPELRPHLEECFDLAEPGAEFVITISRDGAKNFRTRFAKIIRRAGLTPWPRAFHNLRASRQTELASVYAAHVVCAWLGNTEAVAREHYLRVTEADFERAVREPTSALQNPVQYAHAQGRNATQLQKADNARTPVLPGFATHCDAMPVDMIPPRGVEPLFPD